MTPRQDGRPTGTHGLQVHDIALQAAAQCLVLLQRAQAGPGDLMVQAVRSVQSVALNIAEAAGRSGRDRTQHFRVAYGSAQETRTALRLLCDSGRLPDGDARPVLDLLDRVCAMTWRLTGK